jgi:predicted nucleic acid-binding protein
MGSHDMPVLYWDTSAILSALFMDSHSDVAQRWSHTTGVHLMSTLAFAETCAVIARIHRERLVAEVLIAAAYEVLETGPWRRLNAWPAWDIIQPLSEQWPLRGAGLWHLATAKTLQRQLPELFLLTFDARLQTAAQGEDMLAQMKWLGR